MIRKYLIITFFFWGIFIFLCNLILPQFKAAEFYSPQNIFFSKLENARITPTGKIHFSVEQTFPLLHPTQYEICPDDVIESFHIDQILVDQERMPLYLNYFSNPKFDLGSSLSSGNHRWNLQMKNLRGDFRFKFAADSLDPKIILLTVSSLIAVWFSLRIFTLRQNLDLSWQWILFLGISLRIIYFVATPYFTRQCDWEGHVDYIRYIVDSLSLPPAYKGWEFYHPPLYYILMAGVSSIKDFFKFESISFFTSMQVFGLICSLGTFWMGVKISRKLLDNSLHQKLFSAIIACFGSLVMLSARINNDTLNTFLGFLFIYYLICFWKKRETLTWVYLSITAAAALLTKSNSAVLIMIGFLCAILLPRTSPQKQITYMGILLFFVVAISGWFHFKRWSLEQKLNTFVVGNIRWINPALKQENSFQNLTTFNPIEMIKTPFNNDWDKKYRPQNFWEFFFRSAFFGEYSISSKLYMLGSLIVLVNLISLPIIIIGFFKEVTNLDLLPIHLCFGVLLLAALVFRILFPYSCSQDFRYSILLLIPLTHYFCSALRSPRLHHEIILTIAILNIFSQSIFLMALQ